MSSKYYIKRLRVKEEKRQGRRTRPKRAKSFKTEEAANKYAESKKIKGYELKDLCHSAVKNKIIVVKN
ncbi:MAG: hypothetical protein ABIJ08_01765 [Nanoarchaeota archaeon]